MLGFYVKCGCTCIYDFSWHLAWAWLSHILLILVDRQDARLIYWGYRGDNGKCLWVSGRIGS